MCLLKPPPRGVGNRQGEVIKLKDQNETVHEYLYDKVGRRTTDKVTTLPGILDDSVKRLEWAYEDRGGLSTVTSYNAASSGTVVNQVALVYNGFGKLTDDKQEHGTTVGGSTPKTQITYADGSANHARPTGITYPGGRIVRYEYDSGADDNLGRVSFLADNDDGDVGTHRARYAYLGLSNVVQVNYEQRDIRCDLAASEGSDPYHGESGAGGPSF